MRRANAYGLVILLLTACAPMTRQDMVAQLHNSHPEIAAKWGQQIASGTVVQGMPKEAVVLSWGRPSSISEASYRGDIWHYSSWGGYRKSATVFFNEKGFVEDWSTR